jgi:Flp pilus assembly protein TadG
VSTRPRYRRRTGSDRGQITAFVAVVAVGLLALAGLVVDGGRALAAKSRAISLAAEAARAGAQQLDLTTYRTTGTRQLDPAAARFHADAYLTANDADARSDVTATTATVTVTVTISTDTALLGLVGVTTLTVTGTATARPTSSLTPGQAGPP